MNSRFKTLAVAAGFEPDIFYNSENYDYGKQLAMFEKYAESIVLDCMDIVENAVARREPASTYVNKIRDHFYVDSSNDFNNLVRKRCEALVISILGKERANEWWVRPNVYWAGVKPVDIDPKELYTYLMNRTVGKDI